MTAVADNVQVSSPDGHIVLTLYNDAGRAEYDIAYDNHQMLTRSRLGFKSDLGDFSQNLTLQEVERTSRLECRDEPCESVFLSGWGQRCGGKL